MNVTTALMERSTARPDGTLGINEVARAVVRRVALLACALLLPGCGSGSSSISFDVLPTPDRELAATRCITDVTAASRHVFECDGVEFKVMLTQACVDAACGLIVDVHGWLSNPDEQEGRSNLARAALDRGGYIVVQPGELSSPSSWNPATHYDIVADFLQQAIDAFAVDTDRIHFTGFSQGGQMTWKFICDHSELLASAAPISAPEAHCFRAGDGPPRQLPLLYISGTEDVLVRYFRRGNTVSVVETLLAVLYDYGITTVDVDAYEFTVDGDLRMDDAGRIDVIADDALFELVDGSLDGSYLWTRHTNAGGVAVEHLRHTNGHVYPDNPDSLVLPEDPSVWFSIGDAIIDFFIDNPKR